MVYKLASPCRINDTSWIKPGKLAWDYWNAWNIYGVDFRAGINTNTYLYYIDFAAKNGIEYVLLDEGWAESTDIMKVVPEIDLPYIIRYARLKGVSILLWGGWLPLSQKMDEALEHYAELGVKGFKVDFMDRDDQKMVNFYYRLAQKAAEHNLIIDFHGAYKPTGLQRTYPNVINFEGVYGLEYLKGDYPDMPFNDVTIPYIRMLAGPVDYTPGAMVNANKESYRGIHSIPMSQGTRAHQVALYVVFESPLNMLADSPNNYMKEQETTDFLRQIPTVFDQTVALDGKVGEYAVIAREKSDIWYLGAITNWETREITIDFSFLKEGNWQMELFRDGVNADRNGNDYKREVINVNINSKIKVSLAPGGGMAAIIRKINH
ncbi:glycoside hydrolase family 97 catalytic domain-containing protein [Bacteroides salyersiae]